MRCGLSPLARGTRCQSLPTPGRRRFIPAGAGNTFITAISVMTGPVYPRWRGEHAESMHNFDRENGLSPLARGTQKDIRSPALPNRFIPAGAGNTSRCRSCSGSGPVYPRWRGEHHRYPIVIRPAPGLSPLARGTHFGNRTGSTGHRFIPAGAGNTQKTRCGAGTSMVYPRWRGEHFRLLHRIYQYYGLSPLARGTPDRQSRQNPARRFIPAGAGNPPVFFRGISVSGLSPLARGTVRGWLQFV